MALSLTQRKPNLTDRAKRYRANRDGTRPPGSKVCGYCGSTDNVEVDHIDGAEAHNWPQNLIWACRSCNTRKGLYFSRLGIGTRTAQFNPRRGIGSYSGWAEAVDLVRGDMAGSRTEVLDAVARLQGTPESLRRQFAERMRRNPSLLDLAGYLSAANSFDTFRSSNLFQGLDQTVRHAMNTPRSRFDRWVAEARRRNPTGRYPTYQQYGFAVAAHRRGSHDVGGAIIHATPPGVRSEYARRIAEVKRERRGEAPF